MSVALPLPNMISEQLAGLRPDKAAETLRGGQDDANKDARQFTSLLSELNARGTGLSDRLAASNSGTEPQDTVGSGDERWPKADAGPTEANASSDVGGTAYSVANPPVLDPSWSMLLMNAPDRSAASTSGEGAPDSSADRSPGGRPASASGPPQDDLGGETPSAVDSAQSMTLDQALAAAARPDPKPTEVAGRAPPSMEVSSSFAEQSASLATPVDDAAYSGVAPAFAIATLPKSDDVGDDGKESHSATVASSKDDARPRTAAPGSRGADLSIPESSSLSPNQTSSDGSNANSNNSGRDLAPETIRDVKIQSLETHLPVALSDILVAQVKSDFGFSDAQRPNVTISIAPSSVALDTQRQSAAPTKLLTIELEPASLGAVTVKMKMSRSNIDMQIRVESLEALRSLDATREKLVDAMQSSGCTVDSCTIQVASKVAAASAPDGSQSTANGGGQSAASSGSEAERQEHIGREGANHGGQSGYPRENAGGGKDDASRDMAPRRSADPASGVYL